MKILENKKRKKQIYKLKRKKTKNISNNGKG
jgi:hypothetical protein